MEQTAAAAGQALKHASAAEESTTQLRLEAKGTLHEQFHVAQAQTKQETERLRLDVEDVLHTQLSTAQEINQAKLGSVATQFMQHFESGLTGERETLETAAIGNSKNQK